MSNEQSIAEYLLAFQEVVAGGGFPHLQCPYPVSAVIYVALRWHMKIDGAAGWGRTELDALFRAFFWQNALRNRYDQAVLTQVGNDIVELKKWLTTRAEFPNVMDWVSQVQTKLDDHMRGTFLPSEQQLIDSLTDGRPSGALQRAFSLPMIAGVKKDLVTPTVLLEFPSGEPPEMHHIFPRSWCQNNKVGALANLLDEIKAERDWVNSMANMMPLSRKSNAMWKSQNPGAVLAETKITYDKVRDIAQKIYIDEECFELLLSGAAGIPKFWDQRAKLMAADLIAKTKISL